MSKVQKLAGPPNWRGRSCTFSLSNEAGIQREFEQRYANLLENTPFGGPEATKCVSHEFMPTITAIIFFLF